MKFGKLVGIVVFTLSLFILWRIRVIVLLGFLAITLATLLNRVVRRLIHGHIKRGWAIAITLIMVFTVIAVILAIAIPPFFQQVAQWLDRAPNEISRIRSWIDQLDSLVPFELPQIGQQLDAFIQDIPQIIRGVFSNFLMVFRRTLSILLNSLLVLAVTVMLLADPKAYRRVFVSLFPDFYRDRIEEVLDDCEESLVGWGVGILFNMAVITLMSFIGLMLLDVPLPIANAFTAGILTFIPNVGPVLSVIPPAVLALLESPWKALGVIILYIAIQQIESNFLTPLVMNRQVSLLPAATLLFQLVFALLFGLFGLFLALPIVVVGQVWLHEVLVKDIMDHWRRPRSANGHPAKDGDLLRSRQT